MSDIRDMAENEAETAQLIKANESFKLGYRMGSGKLQTFLNFYSMCLQPNDDYGSSVLCAAKTITTTLESPVVDVINNLCQMQVKRVKGSTGRYEITGKPTDDLAVVTVMATACYIEYAKFNEACDKSNERLLKP